MEQLFVFSCGMGYFRLVLASSEHDANIKLSGYIYDHPNVPKISEWKLEQICSKFAADIFGMVAK